MNESFITSLGMTAASKLGPGVVSEHTSPLRGVSQSITTSWGTRPICLKKNWDFLPKSPIDQKRNLRGNKSFLSQTKNGNTTYQNKFCFNFLGDKAKAVSRGKFTAMNVYIKKQERSHISSLSMHLKQLEKEEKWSPRLAEERKS